MRKLITLSLATTSLLMAGTPVVPSISDVVHEITPPVGITPKAEPLIDVGGVQKYAPAMEEDKSGKTTLVTGFKLRGAKHISEAKLQPLIASYTNKELTFGQLQEVASLITKAYRTQGYFVARAYLPVQTMQGGIVEISIIEGNFGEFKPNNTSLVKDAKIQGVLDAIKGKDIISTHTLERAMLILNDTPGVKVTQADAMPGKTMGTSDFAIKTEATPRYDGYLVGDNYGSRYTGTNRLMGGLNLNSPTGNGDKLSVLGIISNGSDLKYGRVAYSVPLMSNGLRGELSYANTHYVLSDRYATLNAYGTARTLEGGLTYPVIRTRHESLNLTSSVAIKALQDYQNGTLSSDKAAKVFTLGANHTQEMKLLGLDAKSNEALTLTTGNLHFKDATSQATDAAGANTQGHYTKLSGYVGGALAFTQATSLSANLLFQKALGHKNLDGTEDFLLGGSNGIKVYPISELSAEDGIMLNTELFQALPNLGVINHKVGLFHDVGTVRMANTTNVTTFQGHTLQDMGLGYYASYQGFFAKAQIAHTLGGYQVTSENPYHTKFLAQLGWSF
jgi:hemolysin activation/secretion protein